MAPGDLHPILALSQFQSKKKLLNYLDLEADMTFTQSPKINKDPHNWEGSLIIAKDPYNRKGPQH